MKNLILFLSISYLSAQFNYSGEINPSVMTRTSNKTQIDLPYRIMSVNLGYTLGNLDFKIVSALEHRNNPSEWEYDIREAYFAYYPDWGEVKVGKQIHAWGAADGNNPTDNINAYDYYYLFNSGAGKKVGSFSFSAKIYYKSFQLEGIFTPKHEVNRFPYGEKDFPLAIAEKPEIAYPVEDDWEFGFRIQTTVGESDLGLSIFNGNDRSPTLLTANVTFQDNIPPQINNLNLGYRTTTMWGLDFVTFIGDLTLRMESALFKTKTPLLKLNIFKTPLDLYEFQQEINYLQSVFQIEYTTLSDMTIVLQLIGNKVFDETYDWYHTYSLELVGLPNINFQPGMGTPFAMFSDQALLLSSSGVFMDDRLEVNGNVMMNLDEKGQMLGSSIAYSPWINWKVEVGFTKFTGDKNDLENKFTLMEDFSNTRVGIIYNF